MGSSLRTEARRSLTVLALAAGASSGIAKVGGNVLVGGSDNSIALQPLSVQGQIGLSVAAGLESLELRPGR